MNYPSDNVAVMVSFAGVAVPINKMVNVIEGISLNTAYPQEEESIRQILYESLNEYMQFALPKLPSPQNICFEHYLTTRFQAVKDIINPPVTEENPYPNKSHMMFLNAQWAIACAELGRQLLPGIRDLNNHSQEVDGLEMFQMESSKQGVYVLTGKHYDLIDMEEAGL